MGSNLDKNLTFNFEAITLSWKRHFYFALENSLFLHLEERSAFYHLQESLDTVPMVEMCSVKIKYSEFCPLFQH